MFNGWSSEEVVASELKSIARWSSCCSWRKEEYEEMWRGGSRSGDKSRNHYNVNKVKHLIQKGFCLNSVIGSRIMFFVLLFQHLLQSRSLILNLRLKKELLKGESFLFWSQSFLVLTSLKINCSFWRVELMWNFASTAPGTIQTGADWSIASQTNPAKIGSVVLNATLTAPAVLRRPILISHVPLQHAGAQCKEMQLTGSPTIAS